MERSSFCFSLLERPDKYLGSKRRKNSNVTNTTEVLLNACGRQGITYAINKVDKTHCTTTKQRTTRINRRRSKLLGQYRRMPQQGGGGECSSQTRKTIEAQSKAVRKAVRRSPDVKTKNVIDGAPPNSPFVSKKTFDKNKCSRWQSRVYNVNGPTSQWNMTVRTKGGGKGMHSYLQSTYPRERQLAFHLRES